jgi:phospholipase C
MDRRSVLKSMGLLAATPLLKACGAEPPRPLSDTIDTVVVLMMENRSFDHYLGALTLEGRTDVDGLDLAMSNLDADGAPVRVAPAEKSCVIDPGHGWSASHAQFAGGTNGGFVLDYEAREGRGLGPHVMGFLDRTDLPALYGLADEYAVCDRWFASLMTSTWPNRFYSLGAQNKGIRGNDFEVTYDFPTVYDVMTRAGRTWGIYYSNVSFSSILARSYPRERFHGIEQLFDDAAAGALPNFTMIEPIYGLNDDHPPAHPLSGQAFIAQVYDALSKSPQWDRMLVVVTYDEHGGFFDHVPPPTTDDERASEGFDQLGFRVPSLVLGPWVKRRHASHVVYDHTSILATLSALFGTAPLTARDRAAKDLLDTLDLARIDAKTPAPPITLPTIELDESVSAPECRNTIGLAQGTPARTGQPELERWLDLHRHAADRRAHSEQLYVDLLTRAEKSGLVRRKLRGL